MTSGQRNCSDLDRTLRNAAVDYTVSISSRLMPRKYSTASKYGTVSWVSACSWTTGFALKAIPRPDAESMSMSLAPSPTATVCSKGTPTSSAKRRKALALPARSTISPTRRPVNFSSTISRRLAAKCSTFSSAINGSRTSTNPPDTTAGTYPRRGKVHDPFTRRTRSGNRRKNTLQLSCANARSEERDEESSTIAHGARRHLFDSRSDAIADDISLRQRLFDHRSIHCVARTHFRAQHQSATNRYLRHVGDCNAARLERHERGEELSADADAIRSTHRHEKCRRTHF